MTDAVPAPKPPRTLGFFETLGFALLAYAAFAISSWLSLVALLALYDVPEAELSNSGYFHAVVVLGALPCVLGVLWIAVRRAGRSFSEYLALTWPERNEIVLALIVMYVVLQMLGLLGASIGVSSDPGVVAEFKGLKGAGSLFLFLVAACIGAPIFEEFAVRGFLFRGWSESPVRPEGAIVLSSAIWAGYHFQYDLFGRFEIFVMGLVLGYFRYRSGSTFLPVVVHSAINLVICLAIA
ncbi:CPBP family intramembrane glutamic endopeptidase [Bradyrhizobium sp. HKCCYLS2038]|uniref:CPBP family intramembrane glutamic endopeptidase n=1 Tax=unclassified Bradyrhizobium TaxID=2631580 RepID=UPI003EC09669